MFPFDLSLRVLLFFCSFLIASNFNNFIFETNNKRNISHKEPSFEKQQQRVLQTNDDGDFLITWDINILGKDYLLASPYLKAGFEQIIKDFINNDIKCEDELEDETTAFFNVEVIDETEKKFRKISGSGKCKGRRDKCRRRIKQTISDAGRALNFHNSSNVDKRNNLCENFRQTSIFESFQNIFIAATSFNYNVDVDIVEDIVGNLDLNYKVTFETSVGDGLNQISNISLDPGELTEFNTICSDSECVTQQTAMQDIFRHFDIPIIENKHECAYEGVNCDQNDRVVYIWMGKYCNQIV